MNWAIAEAADPSVVEPWTYQARTEIERTIWLEVLAYHAEMGIVDPDLVVRYGAAAHVDTRDRELEIEARTRHDVKARIEAWNEVVGAEAIHLGMTSADIVDNAAQVQFSRSAAALARQMGGCPGLSDAIGRYPLRGIWGAVGTGLDQVELTGRREAPGEVSRRVADRLGFDYVMGSVGQQYPRSIDLDIAGIAVSATRAMVPGSPIIQLAGGYLSMLSAISGDQWGEGDVSSSVVRRIALPGVLLACSAALCASRTSQDA